MRVADVIVIRDGFRNLLSINSRCPALVAYRNSTLEAHKCIVVSALRRLLNILRATHGFVDDAVIVNFPLPFVTLLVHVWIPLDGVTELAFEPLERTVVFPRRALIDMFQ